LLLLVGIVSAQQKKISLEANYPLLVDQNLMGKHFKGKADLGVTYDLAKNLFSQIQDDFSKMKGKDGFPDVDYNTNVTILKVGLGYRF